jgi:hypothetical protein
MLLAGDTGWVNCLWWFAVVQRGHVFPSPARCRSDDGRLTMETEVPDGYSAATRRS